MNEVLFSSNTDDWATPQDLFDAQYEWCRQWGEEHRRKITRKKQKKIRRVQHWCNCKLYIKYAWYEFRAMVKG
ncbi:MAG: phosphorylated CTD interacting factor 1 WW domain [Bacteriophage sp.]|nr:MAG: phosphorylated CTD interacting factor 1 WW domain [Bacteriophage sp.]